MLKWFTKRRFNWIDISVAYATAMLCPAIGWWSIVVLVAGIFVSALAETLADRA